MFAYSAFGEPSVSTNISCSRVHSKAIRKYLYRNIYSRLTKSPNELPQSCQLNPLLDMFNDQESHKHQETGRREWKCTYCNKVFKNEMYLDRHLDNKHSDKIVAVSIFTL